MIRLQLAFVDTLLMSSKVMIGCFWHPFRDVISTFGLAEAHNVEALLNHAADFISTNMEDLLNSIHFLEADSLDVAAFFRSERVEH